LFLIDGEISVAGEALSKRDGIGIYETDEFSITAIKDSQILLIEIPMN
jgi:redox-sensitive bicupin YhaK (pirin superfamily)